MSFYSAGLSSRRVMDRVSAEEDIVKRRINRGERFNHRFLRELSLPPCNSTALR